ncbi:MAG: hypothetical protein IJ033_03205 [Clostridia bacterium]|nr:hypothetical protein [Clostridia bacterium]
MFAIIMVLQNEYLLLIAGLFSIAIHEWAHARAAYNEGYYLDTLNLMPYGAMLSGESDFSENAGIKIAFAGPLMNFILCIILLALWWIMPATYSYTKIIFDASLGLGFFNLLPIFPLDGARIIIAIAKNKLKIVKLLKSIGIVISGVLGILFLSSFFFKPNLSLGIICATIYISSIGGSESETYKHICDNCIVNKKMDVPIEKRSIIVHYNLKLIRLVRQIKPNTELTFEIVNDNYEPIAKLNEKEILHLAQNNNIHIALKELLRP